jgi:haloalkane dehalogenase
MDMTYSKAGNEPPPWLDRDEYPFTSRYFRQPDGLMHYIDEGQGEALVFVHGNPSWSFEYRRLIKHFARTNRCIAPDHMGFGLSETPPAASYLPQYHAGNFARFIGPTHLSPAPETTSRRISDREK